MTRFKKVVFSIDSQNLDPGLIEKAIRITSNFQSEIFVVDVIREFSWMTKVTLPGYKKVMELVENDKQKSVEMVVNQFRAAGLKAQGEVVYGMTSTAVIEFVEKNEIDLVIRINKGKGSRESSQLGRTSKRVLRKCPCAVWLVHSQTKPVSENVVACIDTTGNEPDELEFADNLIEVAESLRSHGHGLISIIHAWECWNEKMVKSRISDTEFQLWKESCKRVESEQFDLFLARHSKSVADHNVFLIEGDPSVAIPKFVRDVSADVVVLGTIGRSGFGGFLMGNTAERIFDRVDCDVLALKK